MTLGDFICKYRNDHGLSQRKFAEICGLSNGYISMLEKGYNPNTNKPLVPSLTQLKKLADAMGMTVMQLFETVDDMPVDIAQIAGSDDVNLLPKNIIPLPEMRRIPLLGSIACGAPILAEEHIEDYVDIPKNIHADFALTCKGDSMINARIFDGDTVYIRQQPSVENGEIAAVLIEGDATLKRVRLYEDHVSLEPENPMYKPLVYWGSDMNNVHILGKAIAFTSAIK